MNQSHGVLNLMAVIEAFFIYTLKPEAPTSLRYIGISSRGWGIMADSRGGSMMEDW